MMLDCLPPPTEDVEDPRGQYIDGPLQVRSWPEAGVRGMPDDLDAADGAPSWWHGEEVESQAFLRDMRINLDAE